MSPLVRAAREWDTSQWEPVLLCLSSPSPALQRSKPSNGHAPASRTRPTHPDGVTCWTDSSLSTPQVSAGLLRGHRMTGWLQERSLVHFGDQSEQKE